MTDTFVPVENILTQKKLVSIYNYWVGKYELENSEEDKNITQLQEIAEYLKQLDEREKRLKQEEKNRLAKERKMQKEEKERIEFEHKEKIRNELERNKVEQQTIKDIIQDKTTLLKNIQDETRKEYEEMILAFETKHGIINLKKEIDDNRKSIIRLEAQSKNICDHPVSCRKSSAEGWSHSWYCDLCNFKDIDYYGPGN